MSNFVLSFVLGFIVGVLIQILIFVILAYFRGTIHRRIDSVGSRIQSAGPSAKGFIFEPEDDATRVREEIIEQNRREGKDTHISELQ